MQTPSASPTTPPALEAYDDVRLTLAQFVGVLQEVTGTNPETTGHVVASFNNARAFQKWAVCS